jgi:hypothetical protein
MRTPVDIIGRRQIVDWEDKQRTARSDFWVRIEAGFIGILLLLAIGDLLLKLLR